MVAWCSCSFSKEAKACTTASGDGTAVWVGKGEEPEGSFAGLSFVMSVFSSATGFFTPSVLFEMQNQDQPL